MRRLRRLLVGRLPYTLAVLLRGEYSVFERLETLKALEKWGPDRIAERQRQLLVRMLKHTLTWVPHYREHRELAEEINAENAIELLRRLPILEKERLQDRPDLMRAEAFHGSYSTKTTGGSTGRPVTVYKDSDAIAQEMAATWLGYGWFGIEIGDPCVRFWGSPRGNPRRWLRYMAADIATNRRTLSAFGYTRTDLDAYVGRIDRFRPTYLYGYVSVLEDLARYLLDRGRGLSGSYLKCVVTTAEVLSPPQRRVLQKAFQVPVQNEYGCGELGPIAYECPSGSLHLLPTNQFIEIVSDDGSPAALGEAGHIILTDLTNRVMPLVRYRVGDMGRLGGACTCGRDLPVLDEVFGREYDFVETSDGRKFHGEFFMYAFEDLRRTHPEIGQFKVVQEDQSSISVRVLTTSAAKPSTDEAIRLELERRLPGFQVDVERVERLTRRPSGKMRVVENRLHDT